MKMDSEHIVPLSRQALEVLETMNSISGDNELVFHGERSQKKPMSENNKLKKLLAEKLLENEAMKDVLSKKW